MQRTRYLIVLVAALLANGLGAQQTALVDAPAPSASLLAEPRGGLAVLPAPVAEPRAGRLSLRDWSSIGVAATLRVLDYTTTEKAMAHPQEIHEAMLPAALVRNQPGFAAFEAGTVAANYFGYRFLVRHGRRRLAFRTQCVYDASLLYPVIDNSVVLKEHNLE